MTLPADSLYKTYAWKFTAYEKFWARLSGEEMEHANRIRKLLSRVREGSLSIAKDRFKKELIESFSAYLNRELVRVQSLEMELFDVLTVALNIETNILERKYFETFQGDDGELEETFSYLAATTADHAARVEALWRRYKR